MRPWRREAGQASIEYVVVAALVVVVFAAGAALGAGDGIANAVLGGMRRALCAAGAGGCATAARQPCVVATSGSRNAVTVDVALVRLGGDRAVLRELRSDGTAAVTVIDHFSAGAVAGLGVHGELRRGGLSLGGSAEVRGALVAQLGHGRTWRLRSEREADELIKALRRGGSSGLPIISLVPKALHVLFGGGRGGARRPDEESLEAGGKVSADAIAGNRIGGADLSLAAGLALGGRRDRRSGARTVYLRIDGTLAATLRGAFAGLADTGSEAVLAALTFDRSGRARRLALIAQRARVQTTSLPQLGLHKGGPGLRAGGSLGDRASLEAVLDLMTEANARAARALLDALNPFHDAGAGPLDAARSLAHRFEVDGRLEVASYATAGTSLGAEAEVALGLKLGGAIHRDTSHATLTAAWSRPPGGLWEQRADCLAKA